MAVFLRFLGGFYCARRRESTAENIALPNRYGEGGCECEAADTAIDKGS
jgi:hypothetical protein